jgi:hypothetical protein
MRGAPSGSRNGRAKLTAARVRAARQAFEAHSRTSGARALARQYGVSHQAMLAAINGETWRDS